MATAKKTTTTAKKSATKKPAAKKPVTKQVELVETPVTPEVEQVFEKQPVKQQRRLAEIDLREMVDVQNLTGGALFYRSKEGYVAEWANPGDVVTMTVEELLKMRNQQVGFFTKQWVLPVGDNAQDVIDSLQLKKYYVNVVSPDKFKELLELPADQLKNVLESLSESMRDAVVRYGYGLYVDGDLDRLSTIRTLEDVSGYIFDEQ